MLKHPPGRIGKYAVNNQLGADMKPLPLLAASASLVASIHPVAAQQASSSPAAAEATEASEVSEVIVTGTRRSDRTVLESSAPIDVLSGTDLQSEATTNMLDTLSNAVPSFIVGQNSISDASSFVRSPSLRGLPGDEMLVMLDGKRMNRSALVQVYQGGETELSFGSQGPDLASIPSISIKNLEILRDGASAQYGSDAIAGVLNFQFRDNPSGIELTSRLGEYFPGHGFPNDGWDRSVAGNIGLPLGNQGFFNVSAEFSKNEQTTRGVTRPSALAFAENYPNLAQDLPHYPGPVQQWGSPPSQAVKLVVNSGIKLDNGDKVYFFANYADIQTNESFNYRLPKTVTDSTGTTFSNHPAFNNIYLTACPTTYTGCPAGGYVNDNNTFNFSSVYPGGFTPRFYGQTQEFFATVGYKGTSDFGLNYDFSGSEGSNSLAVGLKDSLNPSLGPLSPTSFNDGKFVQRETTFNVDLSYPWTVPGLASPLSVAGGLEWHDENYQQLLGDQPSYISGPYAYQPLYNCTGTVCTPDTAGGAQVVATQSSASNGYGGISASVDASQINYAAYLDLEADVLQNLTLGLAGRQEHYDSFGSTTLGKFSARWKIIDAIALRGTVSTGFHAPTPGQSNVETLSTTFIPGTATQVQIGTYPVTSTAAKYYGATTLKPEESDNYSLGLVLTPIQDLLLTIDGYDIEVRHRIGISSQFNVTQADITNLPDLRYIGAGGTVQYFTNGFNTKTKGADVVATYRFDLGGMGRLATTLAYNYNKTDVTQIENNLVGGKLVPVISAARIVDIQHYAPNSRANLTLDYQLGPFQAVLHENFYGTFRDENDYPGQLFSTSLTTDLDLAYNVWRNITVAVGGKNITNTYPDKIKNSSSNTVYSTTGGLIDGEVYPRTGGPFGFNGAFWYLRLAAKF